MLLVLVHDVSIVNVLKTCYHTKKFVQQVNLMLKGLAR